MADIVDTGGKAVRPGYEKGAFFFTERTPEDSRLVVWTADPVQLQLFLDLALSTFPHDVEVLLKWRPLEMEDDDWGHWWGRSPLSLVQDTLHANVDYVCRDGGHQLCLKRHDTGELIAIDDHGIVFIYSRSDVFPSLCRATGFAERTEELIFTDKHYHRNLVNADIQRHAIIRNLGLHAVEDEVAA